MIFFAVNRLLENVRKERRKEKVIHREIDTSIYCAISAFDRHL